MGEQICKATREPIANMCMNRLQSLADRATGIQDRVRSKLMSVVTPTPGNPCCPPNQVAETWPPLFDSLRNSMDIIEAALDGISMEIDRAEM